MDPTPADAEIPWALQIAVRYDKQHPASHLDVCEVTARAVVALLSSPEALHGPWHDDIRRWRDGRIRKLVRRARGPRWREVQALDGCTVEQGSAAARAFVPAPVRPLHPSLAKLQVEGTEFPRTGPSTTDALVRIGISPLIAISTGKAAAQCAHAAQLAWEQMDDATRAAWARDHHRVRVVEMSPRGWARDDAPVSIVDAGFTELDGPAETTRAWW